MKFKDKLKKIINFCKNKCTEIYRPNLINTFIIIGLTILLFVIYCIVNPLNYDKDINLISIYTCISSLIFPLIILLIEKTNDKHDYICSDACLKVTKVFPFIIYFCTNAIILSIFNDIKYCIISCIITFVYIIFMYYNAFKLFSDILFSNKIFEKVRASMIENDIKKQIKNISSVNVNLINKYSNIGIKASYEEDIDISNFERINIYCNNHLGIIDNYNYKIIDRIAKKLEKINIKKYNIIVLISNIGEVLNKDSSCIKIYYLKDYEKKVNELLKLVTDKIYKISNIDYNFCVSLNYESLRKENIEAIKNESIIDFRNGLNNYFDIYKSYIDTIKKNPIDENSESTFIQKTYSIISKIKNDIIEYSYMLISLHNSRMMAELNDIVYKMLFYSYEHSELISIYYLYEAYCDLMLNSLKLNYSDLYENMQTKIFDFLDLLFYDISIEKIEFQKKVLQVINEKMSDVIYSLKNNKNFDLFLKKIFTFIENIYNTKSTNIKNTFIINTCKEILDNYNINMFATLSYIVKYFESNNIEKEKIMNILELYEKYDSLSIIEITLNILNRKFNEKSYHWEFFEFDSSNLEKFHDNTNDYVIHLCCLLLNELKSNKLEFPNNYLLINNADKFISELSNLNCTELVNKFKMTLEKIHMDIINNSVSEDKIKQFKEEFCQYYEQKSLLAKIFKSTNNYQKISDNHNDEDLILKCSCDKKMFLSDFSKKNVSSTKMLAEECSSYFILKEEKKIAEILDKKTLLSSMKISEYLSKKINLNNLIIFANDSAISSILGYSKIIYKIKNKKYKNLKSDRYLIVRKKSIPIYSINGLNDDYIYLFQKDKIGIMQKNNQEFNINIKNIKARKNKNLLELVNLCISEYVRFDDKKMEGIKFEK